MSCCPQTYNLGKAEDSNSLTLPSSRPSWPAQPAASPSRSWRPLRCKLPAPRPAARPRRAAAPGARPGCAARCAGRLSCRSRPRPRAGACEARILSSAALCKAWAGKLKRPHMYRMSRRATQIMLAQNLAAESLLAFQLQAANMMQAVRTQCSSNALLGLQKLTPQHCKNGHAHAAPVLAVHVQHERLRSEQHAPCTRGQVQQPGHAPPGPAGRQSPAQQQRRARDAKHARKPAQTEHCDRASRAICPSQILRLLSITST